jgi:hypothetical protein
MARSHARLRIGMFSTDDDLRACSPHAKLLYVVLLQDPALNNAGVVVLREAMWADDAGLTSNELKKALDELVDRRFAAVDRRTAELLVRTFIRNDKVYEQPNVLKGALAQAVQILSPKLRRVLAAELRRLPPKQPDKPGKNGRLVVYPDPHACAAVLDPDGPPGNTAPNPSENPSPNSSGNPSADPSPNPPHGTLPGRDPGTPGGRGRGSSSSPVATYSGPTTTNTRASRSSDNTPDGFDDFWASYPRKVAKRAAEKAYASAIKRGAEPAEILTAVRRYAAVAATSDPKFVAHPTTWLNQGRYDDEPSTAAGRAPLRAVSGGYEPFRNPTDHDVYDEPLLPIPQESQ